MSLRRVFTKLTLALISHARQEYGPQTSDAQPLQPLCVRGLEAARTMGTDHWALLMATLKGVPLPGCMLFW